MADTARVVSRYVDCVMIRAAKHETVLEFASAASVPVINGLTNLTHPCQVMADVMTLEEHVAPLKDLTRLAKLNLGRLEIGDDALAPIAAQKTLIRLHLERTKITDKGLEQLKGLENLEYLNLYGTEITDAGLAHLEGLKKLKNIYLWQTKVTDEGVKKLQAAIPTLKIDRGT